MKHIIKVNNIQDAKDNPIRPIVALDANGNLAAFGESAGPQMEFVDLGLASGTKWGTMLIGATNGDTSTSWYGDYYAWGELETKENYSWETYQYANGAQNKLTKYCPSDKSEYWDGSDNPDNLTQLIGSDDVATERASLWRMPTQAELQELRALPNQWINNYDPSKTEHTTDDGGIQGLNGRVFIGTNGNQVFIPAAGYRYSSNITEIGSACHLWSSDLSLDYPNCAYYLLFNSIFSTLDRFNRFNGFSVCPVC